MEKEIRGYYLANNGDLCIGKVTTDTAKPCKKEGFEMKWFDSLEDACASTAGKPFKVAPDVSEEDYQNLCNLAGTDKAERKPFDSGYAASLATQIEKAFWNGKTPDGKELTRLAEAVVRLEAVAIKTVRKDYWKDLDSVEEIRNWMTSEPRKMVRFVEGIGMDMFDDERRDEYEKFLKDEMGVATA